ncbi:ABC transporter substrate-binding protein [Paenibacillus piri]|uniref:ABC transporter substrate-binding protein n=1 Tax=Paenibacillus piri TaxID=2547395 RepID=A0A4R5KJX1_9BACL|nr:ABC transporter substrate-binding protein [Paenibacillus piri]TDF95125.1 ABC transporter substrate-binding protein [Paenibacillus piri]
MKRIISGICLYLSLLLLMSLVSSCSVPQVERFEKSEPSAWVDGSPKVIRFWMRGNESSELSESFRQDMLAYELSHPDIKIEYDFIAYPDVESKWNTAFAGGTAPDLFEIGIINLASRANLNQLAPLDSYIQAWVDRKDIPEPVYRFGSYQGHIYGLGYMYAPNIFVYRKDFFEEAGLNPDHTPKSWDELLDYASKLALKDDGRLTRGGFVIPRQGGEFWLEIFGRQNGNEIVDENGMIPVFDSPSAVEAVQYLLKLLPYSATYNSLNGEKNPFLLNNAAMTYMPAEDINALLRAKPSLKNHIGAAGDVPGKRHSTFNGLRLFAISNSSRHKSEAWDVIQFLMSRERMRTRMKAINVPGTRESLIPEFVSLRPELNSAIMDAVRIGTGRPNLTWSPLYEKYARRGYEEAIFQTKPPEQALGDAVKELLKEIGR